MNTEFPWLTLLVLFPLAAALPIPWLPDKEGKLVRWSAFGVETRFPGVGELVDDLDSVFVGPLSHVILLDGNGVLLPILCRVAIVCDRSRFGRFVLLAGWYFPPMRHRRFLDVWVRRQAPRSPP